MAAPAATPAHLDEWVGSTPSDLPPNPLLGLSVPVGDAKAHHVKTRLYATSRFTNYLPETSSQNGIGIYEEVSDKALDTWIWVPATSRPARPALDRVLPVFDWEEESSSDPNVISFSRKVSSQRATPRNHRSIGGRPEREKC